MPLEPKRRAIRPHWPIRPGRRGLGRGFFALLAGGLALAAVGLLVGCERASDGEGRGEASDGVAAVERSDSSAAPAKPRPRRIILISLDTVGARNVAGYADDGPTPNLAKIAKDGVRFDRFYAASTYTLPSHMSMLTGLDPIEHGIVNLPSRLSPDVPTLASELGKAGYLTRAVVEGGFVRESHGFDQGFAEFERLRQQKSLAKTSIWNVLDWMRAKQDTPYFLFLHTYVAHDPYAGFDEFRDAHPELDLPTNDEIAELKKKHNRERRYPAPRELPAELRHMCSFYNLNSPAEGDWLGCGDRTLKNDFLESVHFEAYRDGLIAAHREGIRLGDRMVGQIRDALIESGLYEDTLLIVTSDHGEGMFEHAIHGHDYVPFDEVVRVPMFLAYPRRIPGGRVVEGLTWHLDLYPTILSLAGVPYDEGLLGDDLTPVLTQGERIPEDRAIHPVLLRPPKRAHMPMRRMTFKGDFKFIEGSRHYGDAEGLLFDIARAPDESENLREAKPQVFAELRDLALDYDGSLTPGEPVHLETGERISPFPGDVEPFQLSAEEQNELEALGYIFDEEDEP